MDRLIDIYSTNANGDPLVITITWREAYYALRMRNDRGMTRRILTNAVCTGNITWGVGQYKQYSFCNLQLV